MSDSHKFSHALSKLGKGKICDVGELVVSEPVGMIMIAVDSEKNPGCCVGKLDSGRVGGFVDVGAGHNRASHRR